MLTITYELRCSGTVCLGTNVLGTIELRADHPAPEQAAWGHLCEVCTNAWLDARVADLLDAAKPGRPPLHAQHLLSLGPPRAPKPQPGAQNGG